MAGEAIRSGGDGGDDAVMRDLRQEARLTPPLADREEARLLERWALGDRQSQTRLVAANLGMVIRLAEARTEKGLPLPDLVQEGSLGLVEALQSFQSSGQTDFRSFAEQKVGEQMDAAIAAEAAAVRDAELLVTAASDYERTEVLLRRTLQRTRYLYTEYSGDELYEGQATLAEILALLPDFRVLELWPEDVLLENRSLQP